ncbi:MAG: hypothetical protein KA141_12735 [Rubrivivax sp.]|nr:hypothetical protein [Rubrivivax sp.]
MTYEWPLASPSASMARVKQHFMNEARQLGATVIADRSGHVVFELTQSGRKVDVSVDIFNDGQTINFFTITPEVVKNR